MAATKGHGNPRWTREEIILALDLYFKCEGKIPSANDPRVQNLSKLLRSMPHHGGAARQNTYRNPDGVAFKLQNLRQLDTHRGLGNVSRMDRAVWDEFGTSPQKVSNLASLIRAGIDVLNTAQDEVPHYEVFSEGRVVTEAHSRLERNPRLRARLIELHRKAGDLSCELCERTSRESRSPFAESIYEAHHVIPLAVGGERVTRISDMALLCACCHRVVHKAIALAGRWLTILEVKSIVANGRDNFTSSAIL